MNAFRVLALAYALTAVLIAPSWLSADDEIAPAPAPAAEQPVEPEAVAVDPAAEPAVEEESAEPPVAVAQEAQAPAAEVDPAESEKPDEPRDSEPVAKAAASGSVTIKDFEFSPGTITVDEGDTVTWNNNGPTVHTATAENGSFDTGNLDKGESGSATFDTPGTIAYICTPHPFMKGKVVVRAASAGSGGSGGPSGADDPTATTADDSADDDGLPATGAETLAIALLGLATLGAGLLLRRRATS